MRFLILGDLSYDFEEVADDLKEIGEYARENASGVILNLEGAITARRDKEIRKRGKHLPQRGDISGTLKALNTAGVTLANNHVMDFSSEGLDDTLEDLDASGIKHTGAGMDLKEAVKPMVFSDGKDTLALFSFGWDIEETVPAGPGRPGCAPRERRIVLDTVKTYAENNPDRKIIVILHWGFEYNLYPQPYDMALAHDICGIKGVFAVIGHHSHCPQPMEIFNGVPVFYSLGNFYYSSRRDRYSKRQFKHDPPNMCDFGLGVLIDTADSSAKPLVLFYDREKDRTEIRNDLKIPVCFPSEYDFRSEEYRKFVKDHSLKKNPVLGTNETLSRITALIFNMKRNLGRFL